MGAGLYESQLPQIFKPKRSSAAQTNWTCCPGQPKCRGSFSTQLSPVLDVWLHVSPIWDKGLRERGRGCQHPLRFGIQRRWRDQRSWDPLGSIQIPCRLLSLIVWCASLLLLSVNRVDRARTLYGKVGADSSPSAHGKACLWRTL